MNSAGVTVEPFHLPLERDQFRDALAKGMGRAPMHIARFGIGGLEEILVEACTSAVVYDPQLEGSRRDWLMGMIEAGHAEAWIAPRILAAFGERFVERNHWDKTVLCEFAMGFARRGHDALREALYSSMHKDLASSSFFGVYEIIQLDGSDGLIFVAERIGQWILDDPTMSAYFDITEEFDEANGEGSGRRILENVAKQSTRIAAFLEYIREFDDCEEDAADATSGNTEPEDVRCLDKPVVSRYDEMRHWSGEEITREIRETDPSENGHRMLYMRWGDDASDDELKVVFEALCNERDQARIQLLLSVFQRRGFLEVNTRALAFAESDDLGTRWSAYHGLSKHEHEEVRDLALRRIRAGRMTEGELGLLVKNYRAGDWSTIHTSLQLSDDSFDRHRMLQDLLEVCEKNRLPETSQPLLIVYEHSPCSLCREEAVKALAALGALPDWVREECRLDANEDTRTFVATS